MKTEVKIAIIGGIVTIIVTILTGFFGYLNSRKPEAASVAPAATAPPAQSAPATTPASQAVQGNTGDVTIISGNGNINAGGNVTIKGTQKR
jgi:uncharacterized protein (UPF0333 family)